MLRINQLKLSPDHTPEDLYQKAAKLLRIPPQDIQALKIRKQSIDARKKPEIYYSYTVDVKVPQEQKILKKQKGNQITLAKDVLYSFPDKGCNPLAHSPVIVGSGPCGLFCAYMLAQAGYRPLILERGASVEERAEDIQNFWNTGQLDPNSNVQFGEGGAGTFSDGKLNTLVKDVSGRNRKVLEIFVENGAPEEILYQNKPHIGTDLLIHVVRNMRKQILRWGGKIHFHSQLTDFTLQDGSLTSITYVNDGKQITLPAEILILAIGHSARDTFQLLYQKQIPMEAKSFAVGVRVEHAQKLIQTSQYGETSFQLPAASYKLATTLENGRGVYSFCMCPGGYVVNASSEAGMLAVNGMSYHARDGENANSAIIVTVSPDDFGTDHPLGGMEFQRKLEKKAFQLAQGKIPVQRFGDYCKNQVTTLPGSFTPQLKGDYAFANVRQIFPDEIGNSIEIGIKSFDKQIHGFATEDALLSGVESRTSSPIRIMRNADLTIDTTGIYPCGEGAGYAGGITSAAMDGLKVAEKIATRFVSFD